MPSISELRKKIKGIKSTRQITSAMKMVAGARFSRAQRDMVESCLFPTELEPVVRRFLYSAELNKGTSRFISLKKDEDNPARRVGLVVISGDKGLCGDFNTSLLREGDKFIKKQGGKVVYLVGIGKKASEWSKKSSVTAAKQYPGIFSALGFEVADRIGDEIMKAYHDQELTELWIVRSAFKSAIKREVAAVKVFPICVEDAGDRADLKKDIEVEPIETEIVLKTVVPQWLKSQLYMMMRHSYASELSARMNAMDNATRNAGSFIDTQTLEMNKVRQSMITREIAEITGTSEVMQE